MLGHGFWWKRYQEARKAHLERMVGPSWTEIVRQTQGAIDEQWLQIRMEEAVKGDHSAVPAEWNHQALDVFLSLIGNCKGEG